MTGRRGAALLVLLAALVVARPAAATTKVTRKGCKITITLKIEIFGAAANKDIAQKIKKDIDDCFPKKHKFKDWCPVKFVSKVVVRKGNKPRKGYHHIEIIADPNDDDVGGTFTSHCDDVGTPDGKTETSGQWDDHESKNTYAHEAGHLMGLDDQYTEGHDANGHRKTTPKPGHEGDKMATLSGMTLDSSIGTIIMKAGVDCPKKCCNGKTMTGTGTTTTTTTTQPSPNQPACSGSFFAVQNEAGFVFSCQETTPITTTGFSIQVPGRQVVNFINPAGFTCLPGTISKSNDALRCSGNVPANQDVTGGQIATSPVPNGSLGGILRLEQGSKILGPYTLTGP
jgi:hypothetical protein